MGRLPGAPAAVPAPNASLSQCVVYPTCTITSGSLLTLLWCLAQTFPGPHGRLGSNRRPSDLPPDDLRNSSLSDGYAGPQQASTAARDPSETSVVSLVPISIDGPCLFCCRLALAVCGDLNVS